MIYICKDLYIYKVITDIITLLQKLCHNWWVHYNTLIQFTLCMLLVTFILSTIAIICHWQLILKKGWRCRHIRTRAAVWLVVLFHGDPTLRRPCLVSSCRAFVESPGDEAFGDLHVFTNGFDEVDEDVEWEVGFAGVGAESVMVSLEVVVSADCPLVDTPCAGWESRSFDPVVPHILGEWGQAAGEMRVSNQLPEDAGDLISWNIWQGQQLFRDLVSPIIFACMLHIAHQMSNAERLPGTSGSRILWLQHWGRPWQLLATLCTQNPSPSSSTSCPRAGPWWSGIFS